MKSPRRSKSSATAYQRQKFRTGRGQGPQRAPSTSQSDPRYRMTVLIAILSVLAALVSSGATVYALTFTQQQVDITRHGLIADRFNKAGDQLGSEKSDVRTVAVL